MRAILCAMLFIASLSAPFVQAHEGHDHDAPPPVAPAEASPRAVATSDEHEFVAILRKDRLVIYLDRFATNEAVTDATVELDTPEGVRKAEPQDGRYELPASWATKPGSYDLLATVTTARGADVLTATLTIPPAAPAPASAPASVPGSGSIWRLVAALGAGFALGAITMSGFRSRRTAVLGFALLTLAAAALYASTAGAHEGEDHGAPPVMASAGNAARRQPDGSIFAPKPMQRLLALRTLQVRAVEHARAIELPGRVIPDPNASGYVQAAVSGRLSPPDGGFPRLGKAVKRGDVLAYVAPPLSAAETSDQRQRQSELDQQIQIVERRLERFERLLASGAATKVQIEEARLELQGLRDRRAALDRNRRAAEPLTAPVDGVIAAVNAVSGQIAETNAIVFQIVDPRRLWIEALSFEALSDVTSASARPAQGEPVVLEFVGSGLADRMQSVPVHFQITGDVTRLRIGQLVSVSVQQSSTVSGIALPRGSVLEGANGQALVYEHTQPEVFEARQVRVAPLNAEAVLVVEGLKPGARIVTQGAELLHQVR